MSDKENDNIMEQVRELLNKSDYDYTFICTREINDEQVENRFGFRTRNGFYAGIHELVQQAKKGNAAARAFINTFLEVIFDHSELASRSTSNNMLVN